MMMKIMMVTITAVRMTKTGLSDTLLIGISAPSHGLTISLMIMMIIMMTLIVSLMIMIFIVTVMRFRKKCSNTNFGIH